MRILITSTDHKHYNETGTIVRDLKSQGVEVELDRSSSVVLVPEKQWKVISLQEAPRAKQKNSAKDENAAIATYFAAEGVLSVLGDIVSP